ncbi:Mitochondrial carrier, partial [Rhizoctonia solani]
MVSPLSVPRVSTNRCYSKPSTAELAQTGVSDSILEHEDPFKESRALARRYAKEHGYDLTSIWEENISWGHLDSFRLNSSELSGGWLLVRFFETSRMHMMYLIGLETNGAKGAKAVLEGHGVSIILKSIDVKFKRPVTYPDNLVIMQRPHNTSPSRFTLSAVAYSLAQRAPVASSEAICVWYDYDVWKKCDVDESTDKKTDFLVTAIAVKDYASSKVGRVAARHFERHVLVNMAEEIDYEALPSNAGIGVNMLAGAMAGISEHAVMFPVDSIKQTRMQVITTSNVAVYSSLGNAVQRIASTEGLRTLWRGVASVILGAGPAHAVQFGTYEAVKEFAGDTKTGHLIAGACASISSEALMNPFDVIKQRMQLKDSAFRSVASCAKAVYRNEGLTAFYISYPTTLTMSVPFAAAQFTAYESIKRVLNPSDHYSPITHVTAGGMAGAFAAAITTPLDVAKTLLQTRGTSDDPRIRHARGMRDAFQIIYDRNGLKGFTRGLTPRVLTFMPSNALCWLCYEFFKMTIRTDDKK